MVGAFLLLRLDFEEVKTMGALIDFFAVRPVFTLYGLRVLWGAYLLSQALPIVTSVALDSPVLLTTAT
jgi:hypothetical protein